MKSFRSPTLFLALVVSLFSIVPEIGEGQLLRRLSGCQTGNCPPAVVTYSPSYVIPAAPIEPLVVVPPASLAPPSLSVETAASVAQQWYRTLNIPRGHQLTAEENSLIRSWALRATRIINGNSCGTGSLVGRDSQSIYIMTNAHVASSRIGNVVQCEALLADGSATEKFSARVIEAAYSSRTSTDWALLRADARFMAGIEPIKMSPEDPTDGLTGTWGCPRCQVPSGQLIRTVRLGSLWYWQPNAIGGQSGSAVIQNGVQKGLLTWTINGDGAGQLTSTIFRQSQRQNTDGPARVDGMLIPTASSGVELIEGYHAESGLHDYPIWAIEPNPEDPVKPEDPPCVEDDDVKRFKAIRDRFRDRGYDWIAILNLVLQLIEILSKGK